MRSLTTLLSVTAITVGLAPSAYADAPFICNHGSINLGVIHFLDGDYTNGTYDVLLHPGKCTDQFPIQWSSAAAYYIGPGYHAVQYPMSNPNSQVIRGSGINAVGSASVGVVAQR